MTFKAHGIALPVPLVEVAVNGVSTLFVVDTGSSDNVITKAFADMNHIASVADAQGTDHANEKVDVATANGLALRVGTTTHSATSAKVVSGPPPFVQLGIGGFLSPQNLVEHGYVVLDFPGHTMAIVDGSAAQLDDWLAARYPGASAVKISRVETDHRNLCVSAALGSKPLVKARVDTGGTHSEFDQAYVGDSATAAPDSAGIAVSGKPVAGRKIEHQSVALTAFTVPDVTIVSRDLSSSEEQVQGLLGMDFLAAFVIAIPADATQPLLVIDSRPPQRSLGTGS